MNKILSDFSCPINPDVEGFLKHQSIDFVKKNQSVTYLVFSNEDAKRIQYKMGGMVVFIETEKNEKLLKFYDLENGFKEFET